MGWTKREIIGKSFTDSGLAPRGRNLTADELQEAMQFLDAMMAEWSEDGIVFTPSVYPQPSTMTGGDLDDDTNAPLYANMAIWMNLAPFLVTGYGKQLPPKYAGRAFTAYNKLLAKYVPIPEMSIQGMLRGAGAKRPLDPFFNVPSTETEETASTSAFSSGFSSGFG